VRILKQGVCLALLGAGLAAVPGLQTATAAGRSPDAAGSLVHQIRSQADSSVRVTSESATGKVGFLRAARGGDLLPSVSGDSATAAQHKADAYLRQYASAFGARYGELRPAGQSSSPYGWTMKYTQVYRGVPVYGSMLKANVDKAGDLTSVNGYAAPNLNLSVAPRLSKSQIGSRAVGVVRADPPGEASKQDLKSLRPGHSDLVVYRMGSFKDDRGQAILAYAVQVTNKHNVSDMVIVDANTGKTVNRYSLTDGFQTDRALYDAQEDPNFDMGSATPKWKEGDPFPGDLSEYEQNLMLDASNSYWLYANAFGRDSFDGKGARMNTVENYKDPDPQYCPNANWNGARINMCPGSEADDVVSHEWGHAYTQYTSGLIYQWQSGALNESYSDVWGETIDLINGRHDEGEGDDTTKRPVGECSTHSPAQPVVTVNTPASIARSCNTAAAQYGPQLDATGITEDVVIGHDAVEDGGGTATDGCSPLDNAAEADGKIVIVDRGLCSFSTKTKNAQDAGAVAVIIGNRDDAPIGMSGDGTGITIPSVSIGLTDREAIKSAITNGETVNVTMRDAAGDRVDSYRWLMGEQAPAFGGALRDMWNPTCYGDPAKVSDAQYKCATDDNGGVHSNSGVPNHAYALLVDGGTYNGVVVRGIGLDKAANLWWRTQSDYLTPSSDFTDMADGLDASCAALTGKDIKKLSVEPNATPESADPITADDCAQVAAVEKAVELRTKPTQCDFQPLLAKGAPPVCGTGTKTHVFWKDDFRHGLHKWKRASEVVYADEGAKGKPWKVTSNAPGGHGGKVAFGPDSKPDEGSCGQDADDQSSADSIISPRITVPAGKSPRLGFAHYVATEQGWDGGNVKIKVWNGPWTVVPTSAYLFNGPNSTLETAAAGNTNPLAGQPAFTGTNGGEVKGSWGRSLIDLKKAGAGPHAKIKIRFDMGRDGCNGVDGWYVDNVKFVVCKKKHHHHHEVAGRRNS
jgi:Zn-dependent metalloprotease